MHKDLGKEKSSENGFDLFGTVEIKRLLLDNSMITLLHKSSGIWQNIFHPLL